MWFAKLDRDLSLWRTRQCSLLEEWEQSFETWPRWGSMQDGECSELGILELPMPENECGYWPTPRAREPGWTSDGYGDCIAKAVWKKDGVRGRVTPEFCEWLMGWPIGHTELRQQGMDRFREWLRLHGGF